MSGSLIGLLRNCGYRSYGGLLCVSLLGLSGCHTHPEMVSVSVTGYNHTSAEIIRFSINGAGGPRIPANLGGGSEVCCGRLPAQWEPGLEAIVEWTKDPRPYEPMERDQYGQIVKEGIIRHTSAYSHHSAMVEIPKYAGGACALQVHFLLCDQVRVSTTCFTRDNPKYPDKAYFQAEESKVCPHS